MLEWRFRDQLSWRLVMIGLREEASETAGADVRPRTATLARLARLRDRYGMPFGMSQAASDRYRPWLSGRRRGRLLEPGREWVVFRALQLANFAGGLYLDDAESIREALR